MCGRGSGIINKYLLLYKWLGFVVFWFMVIIVVFFVLDINYFWDYGLDMK